MTINHTCKYISPTPQATMAALTLDHLNMRFKPEVLFFFGLSHGHEVGRGDQLY